MEESQNKVELEKNSILFPKEKIGFIMENDNLPFSEEQAAELNKRIMNAWMNGYNTCLYKIKNGLTSVARGEEM